jgi:integrase
MRQRQGTILKKCECASQDHCSHKWTLRYWADGRQRELSFADELDGRGRPRYGSGKRLAQDAQLKIAHDKRARVFIDPKLGSARFRDECEKWITRHAGTELTKEAYQSILRAHVGPVLGDRTIAAVAQARDDVIDLLTIRLGEGSNARRKIARALITGVLDEAVRAGKITMHRCGGITLPDNGGNGNHDDFVFPTHAQLLMLANGSKQPPVAGIRYPLTIWLMRGCGLRIEETLAVQKSCFRDGGTVLRVFEQASRDGRKTRPLKHRKAGEYRDIPVPAYLWEMVRNLPDGYFFKADDKFPIYSSYRHSFNLNASKAGIPASFTPHSLRHAFVSALLSHGVPITDVATWLGHRNINVTYAIYGHLVPSSLGRAQEALNAEYTEYTEWSQAA